MKTSIISLLGSTLDAHGPRGKDRWNAWRPNVALAMQKDLLSRIDLWSFRLPGLAERSEDIEPNLDYELERWASRSISRSSASPSRPSPHRRHA